MKRNIIPLTLFAALAGLAGSAQAQLNFPTIHDPILGIAAEELVATGGNPVTITAEFLSESAGDNDVLVLAGISGGTGTPTVPYGTALYDNQTSPTGVASTLTLGSFSAGTQLIFELENTSTHDNYYSGSYWYLDNPLDGFTHFDVVPSGTSGNTTEVGTEDATDFDYNDLVFSFTGVAPVAQAPDMAGTMSLLGLGLSGLAAFGRRFRK
jgi:hypothetical protein